MNILITSVGRRGYLVDFFKKSLKNNGLIHISNSDRYCSANKIDEMFFHTPEILDEKYTEKIFEYCIANEINLVIPLIDLDHYILSKEKQKFLNKNIYILTSEDKIVKNCFDKLSKIYLDLKDKIHYPKTINLTSDEFEENLFEGIKFPLIIKPRFGNGSINTKKVDDFNELKILLPYYYYQLKKRLEKYKNSNSFLKNDSILVQEFIDGDEYNLDIFNSLEGNFLSSIAKIKFHMRGGETEICKLHQSSKLDELGKRISKYLRHIGPLDCDLIIQKNTKKAYLIDLNPRFGGGYPFTHAAGVNYPSFLLNEFINAEKNFSYFNYKKDLNFAKQISVDIIK